MTRFRVDSFEVVIRHETRFVDIPDDELREITEGAFVAGCPGTTAERIANYIEDEARSVSPNYHDNKETLHESVPAVRVVGGKLGEGIWQASMTEGYGDWVVAYEDEPDKLYRAEDEQEKWRKMGLLG